MADTGVADQHFGFRVLGSKFQDGTTTFVDGGRVWTKYTFDDPRDGGPMHLMDRPLPEAEHQFKLSWLGEA